MSTYLRLGSAESVTMSDLVSLPLEAVLRMHGHEDRVESLERYFRNLSSTDLLIGIETSGQAIVWKRNWPLVAVDLDTVLEAAHRATRRIDTVATTAAMETWVQTHRSQFDWLHPRVRWLAVDDEGEQWNL